MVLIVALVTSVTLVVGYQRDFLVGQISDLFVGVIDENGALETLSRVDVPD